MSHKILERIKTVLAWFNLNDYAYFTVTIFSGISSIYVIKKSENFSLGLLALFCFVIGLYYSYRIIYKACKHAVARELFKKGSTKLSEGDSKGAIKAYQRLIDLPEWHGAYVYILLSYALFAEGLFEQVISVKPTP